MAGSSVKIVSVRSFAKLINVSEGAVRKAIKAGHLQDAYDAATKKIDVAAAKKDAWVQKQGLVKPKAGLSRAKVIEKLSAAPAHLPDDDVEDDEHEDSDVEVDLENDDIANQIKVSIGLSPKEAMRRREIVALALDKKKLLELEGTLVRRDSVEKALFLLGSELKKALMDIPARCVRDIMASTTEVEGIKVLTDELIHVLNTYGNLRSNSI